MAIHVQDGIHTSQVDWQLIRFDEERDDFIKRPPYQRKNVWKTSKKKALLESFVRQLYVPPIVLRTVAHETKQYYEVIDGQQRITAIQEYFNDEYSLPDEQALREFDAEHNTDFAGSMFEALSEEEQRHLTHNCTLTVDRITNIDDPYNPEQQEMATQVFWRLQQGNSLKNIEENHSKVYSPVREYIVRRADDISFDMDTYTSRDHNPDRHAFFTLLNYGNNRLKHLALLARFLLIETADGPTKITGKEVTKLFDCERGEFRLDDDFDAFTSRDPVKRADRMLNLFHEIYSDADLVTDDGTVVYFDNEYFIVSLYTLLRDLEFGNYSFDSSNYGTIREFTREWYNRFENEPTGDDTIIRFKANSQQNREAVNARHLLITNAFWESDPDLVELDDIRTFTHSQRVQIFLRDDRVCQDCLEKELADGKDESAARDAARIDWSDYDADHIVKHAVGGETTVENGRVRCQNHNRADNAIARND